MTIKHPKIGEVWEIRCYDIDIKTLLLDEVPLESESKVFIGLYVLSKEYKNGFSILYINEKSLIKKCNYGDYSNVLEEIRNELS